ncbi:MAG: helix-turn-helix transcriptional regulator [Bacteroidales bacterium]|nr:helix-turn-helix transcriptional regulator [Candidatus Scybalousia scybalohippi]
MAIQDRIQQIMQNYGLNSGQFASKLGVQPSNISHVLSGRNKPSLEFVTKIMKAFPDVDYRWLVMNQGSMLSTSQKESQDNVLKQDTKTSFYGAEIKEEKTEKKVQLPDLFEMAEQVVPIKEIKKETLVQKETPVEESKQALLNMQESKPTLKESKESIPQANTPKQVERVIVFYTDNTFEELVRK